MRIKNEIEIKPYEWLCIAALIIILMLAANGNLNGAAELLKELWPKGK
jgi:hypothetical protein